MFRLFKRKMQMKSQYLIDKEKYTVKTSFIHEDMKKLIYKSIEAFYDNFTNLSEEDLIRLGETVNAFNSFNCWCCAYDRKEDLSHLVCELRNPRFSKPSKNESK